MIYNQDSTFKGWIDLSKNEIRNPRMQNLSVAPSSPVSGQYYYDTDDSDALFWNGTTWVSMTGGAGGISSSIVNAKGDLIVGIADDTVARKAVGANNTFLSPNSALGDGLEYRTLLDADIPATIFRDSEHTVAAHQELIATNDLTDWPRTAALDLGSQKITSLADPTANTDAANKQYVDGQVAGARDPKDSVRAATTAALPANTRTGNVLTASANGAFPAQDGITFVVNEDILVKNEATGANNGIYRLTTVGSGAAPWVLTRRTDADSSAEVTSGMYVWVNEGTTNADTGWLLTTNDPITLNTTALVFTQVSALGQIIAGAGLTKTGSTLDVIAGAATATGGPGGGLVVATDSVAIDKSVVMRGYTQLFGDAAAVSFNINHNLGTTFVTVQIFLVSTGATESCESVRSSVNQVVLSGFATAPGVDAYRVIISSIG